MGKHRRTALRLIKRISSLGERELLLLSLTQSHLFYGRFVHSVRVVKVLIVSLWGSLLNIIRSNKRPSSNFTALLNVRQPNISGTLSKLYIK